MSGESSLSLLSAKCNTLSVAVPRTRRTHRLAQTQGRATTLSVRMSLCVDSARACAYAWIESVYVRVLR
jgi:hypothetical protein